MKKIFLLDDNVELIEITEMVLGKEYIVQSSTTADNIADELRMFNPDLIMIDHFIGDSNSEAIVSSIKTAIPGFSIPFILFSASYDIETKAENLGAVGFIEKPASINYIKEYIGKFFKNRGC